MSTPFKQFLALLIVVGSGFITSANAQRGGDHRNGGGWSDRSSSRGSNIEQRSFGSGRDNSSFNRQSSWNRQSQSPWTNNRQNTQVPDRQITNRRVSNDAARDNARNLILGPGNVDRSRSYRNVPPVYNNYRNYNGYRHNYPKVYPTYNYIPRRYVYMGAPRYSILPHSFLSIQFGGYPYYYNSGLFYSYYNGFYEPVYAPLGIHVGILPVGYRTLYLGQDPYYYYEGTYYRNANNDYEVVDAPVGAEVSTLPKGSKAVTVNGEKFYEFNGTYYKEVANSRNEVVYTVVGKYGEINNTQVQPSNNLPIALHNGDIVPNLPDGCKEVTINGEVLYLSPNNIYFKAINNNNDVSYQVVGM